MARAWREQVRNEDWRYLSVTAGNKQKKKNGSGGLTGVEEDTLGTKDRKSHEPPRLAHLEKREKMQTLVVCFLDKGLNPITRQLVAKLRQTL